MVVLSLVQELLQVAPPCGDVECDDGLHCRMLLRSVSSDGVVVKDVESHNGARGQHSRGARLGRKFLNFEF